MKKSILIIGALLTILSFTAFTYINWEHSENNSEIACQPLEPVVASTNEVGCRAPEIHPDFVYNVSNRFMTTITMEDLQKAKSIVDLLPEEATENLSQFTQVKVDTLPNNNNTAIQGLDENLSVDQLKLLRATNHSSNFYLESWCKNDTYEGPLKDYHLVYYLTVVPETPAEYTGGQNALIDYLKEGSKAQAMKANWNEIDPGRLHFTVSKDGEIIDAAMSSSCGHTDLDEQMLDLIKDMPRKWKPATNAKGLKVAQEFVFFYGKEGC